MVDVREMIITDEKQRFAGADLVRAHLDGVSLRSYHAVNPPSITRLCPVT